MWKFILTALSNRTAILFCTGFVLLSMMLPQQNPITIWMIGDSTMSLKDKKAFPEHGWGMPFAGFFDSTVTVNNLAQNGRSTQSFLNEKRWEPAMEKMQEGDYVFIQFGHNDEISTKKTFTTESVFKANLENYVADTRSKKAIPVLLTSVARRKFDSTGNIVDTHERYAAITREVAREKQVILIDHNKLSMELLQSLGVKGSFYLFNHLEPGQHPNYPEGKKDDTHFNELGARKMASLVLEEIRRQQIGLAGRIAQPFKK